MIMAPNKWARLREDVYCGLRRGAWYKVLFEGTNHVAVDAVQERVLVPSHILEIVDARPALWSIVQHTPDSFSFPPENGRRYAVCPNCQQRQAPPSGRPFTIRCQQCNGLYHVDWYRPVTVKDFDCESSLKTG